MYPKAINQLKKVLEPLHSGKDEELSEINNAKDMELLADYNVPLIDYPPEELDEDITNAQRHSS